MALQDLSKTELAGLIAGATAVKAIVGRISKDEPGELPTDQIRQWEIAALYQLEAAKDALALGFKRRLEAGATVQPGPYFLDADTDTMEDLEESQLEYQGGDFNCVGFNGVGWNDPAKATRDTSLDWLTAPSVSKATKKAAKQSGRKAAKRGGRK